MDEATAHLVDYALSVREAALPADTVLACKRSMIDTFGCMLGAFNMPQSRMARDVARRYSGVKPAASVWGCDWSSSAEMASFANGTMLRMLDLSDTYRTKGGGHPSDVIAAVIAAGEAEGASGAAVIAATVVAYEVYCACSDAIDLNGMGWDQPVYGGVASALGAGLLFGLDRAQLAHAASIALTSGIALMQTRYGNISNWKNSAGANASRNGVFAALLARDGFTGPDAALEGKAGLYEVVHRFDWRLPAAHGEPHRITQVYLKNFPVCYHGQASAWAGLKLHPQVQGKEIAAVTVEVYALAQSVMADAPSKWAPRTPETADHSLPYVVAAALMDGKIDAQTYDLTRLGDPALTTLLKKIKVVVAEDLSSRFPTSSGARISVELADGSTHAAAIESAMGHADNPMDQATLSAKFMGLAQSSCDTATAQAFLAAMQQLELATDIRPVIALLSKVEARAGQRRQNQLERFV